MSRMQEGFEKVDGGGRVLALLSHAYMASEYCMAEARYPLTGDPDNERQRLVVFRVAECQPTGFLKDKPYVDLVPLFIDQDKLARAILGAVDPARYPAEADFSQLYRRSGKQHLHPEVRAVPGFTGRDAELEQLGKALWEKGGRAAITNNQSATAAVRGLGGVGKSVLAQEYAWRNREYYEGVWWLRAETEETLLDDLIELGIRWIDKSLGGVPDRRQAALAVLDEITQRKTARPWLLVYDNVEGPEQVRSLVPADGAHALITTRWSDWYGEAEELPVGVFSPEVAVDFLMARARGAAERPEETRAEAAQLAEDLGHLPLALAIARAQAWGMNWSFGKYRAHIADTLKREPKGRVDYPNSVYATFTAALTKVLETAPEAELLLGIAAFLAPDRIPLDIIDEEILSEIALGEAVAALSDVSLVTPETLEDGTPGISVHRLVQQVMRERLGDGAEGAAALATTLMSNAYPFDSDDVRFWPACRRLEAHAMAVLDHAPETGDAAQATSRLAFQHALHLKSRAEFAAAEPLYRRALEIDEASYGPDHPEVAIRLNNLAALLQATNRLSEAEPLIRRALAIDETALGPDHPKVAIRLNNLANLLRATNRLDEAEPLYRRALAIDEASYGPDHPEVATDLNNLASLLQTTNRLDEAEPPYRRALAILEASLGETHPQVATALNNLASLLQDTNRLDEAEPLFRRALAIDEASYGPDHPTVAIRRNNLALLLEATNRLDEALPMMRRAAEIWKASLPDHHPHVQMARESLASMEAEHAARQNGGTPGEPAPPQAEEPPPPSDDPKATLASLGTPGDGASDGAQKPKRRDIFDWLLGRNR